MSTTMNPMYNDTTSVSSGSSDLSTVYDRKGEAQPLGLIFSKHQYDHLNTYKDDNGNEMKIIPQGFIGIHGKYKPLSSFKDLTKDRVLKGEVKVKKDQFSSINFTEYQGINIFEEKKIVPEYASREIESVDSNFGRPGTNKSNLINYLLNVHKGSELETRMYVEALLDGQQCYHVDDSSPARKIFDDVDSLSSKKGKDSTSGYGLVKNILNVTGLRRCAVDLGDGGDAIAPNMLIQECTKYKDEYNKDIYDRVKKDGKSEIFLLLTYYKGSDDEINGNGYVVNVVKKNKKNLARMISGLKPEDVFFDIEKFSIRQNQILVGNEASQSTIQSIMSTLLKTSLNMTTPGIFGSYTKEGMIAKELPGAGSRGIVEEYNEEYDDQSDYGSNASQVRTRDSFERYRDSFMSGLTEEPELYGGPVRAYRPGRMRIVDNEDDSDDETLRSSTSYYDNAEEAVAAARKRLTPTPPVSQDSSSGVGSTSGESVSPQSSVSSEPPVANPSATQTEKRAPLPFLGAIQNRKGQGTNTTPAPPPASTTPPARANTGLGFSPEMLQAGRADLKKTDTNTADTNTAPKKQGLFGDMSNSPLFKAAQEKNKGLSAEDRIKARRGAIAGDDDEEGSDDDTFAGGRGPRGGKRKTRRRSSKKRRKSKKVKGKKAKPKTKGKKIPFKKLLKKTRSKKH